MRFGGTLTLDDAMGTGAADSLGFDHVALCMGAGKPTTLDIPNGLARGVRTASDFLMALQLTGAAKRDSIANMQLRLPVVVIGGGLTAIDTATESLAYYVVQVEKFLDRYKRLAAAIGEDAIRDRWDAEEREIAEEFLSHARAIRSERREAARAGRAGAHRRAARALGRRDDRLPAAAHRQPLVHAEPRGGREGARGGRRVRRRPDAARGGDRRVRRGACGALRVHDVRRRTARAPTRAKCVLPACTVFVAAGTQPNTVLAREDAEHFLLDGKYFRACDEDGNPVQAGSSRCPSRTRADVLMTRLPDGRFVSYFGDLHPSYLRQRREGAGLDQAGLSGDLARAGAAAARVERGATRRSSPGSTASCARRCTR